jgi:hypothetical protein
MWISQSGLKLTFVSGTATYASSGGNVAGVGTATGTIVFKVKPFGGTLWEPAYASGATNATVPVVSSGMLVRIEGRWLASAGDEIYASGAQIAVARDLQSSLGVGQNIPEDTEDTVTAKMTVSTAGELGAFAGNVRFKVEDICSSVGGTLMCQGSGGYGGAVATGFPTGNLTDNWVTNTVYMVP